MDEMDEREVVAVEEAEAARYGRAELLAAATSFGVKPEVIAGALRLDGREELTRQEAEAAIRRFRERMV